jgi:hypothetical protein
MTLFSQNTLFLFVDALFTSGRTTAICFERHCFESYTSFYLNGKNALLVSQQTRSFLVMFMTIYEKVVEAENMMIIATTNERKVTARCYRTQIIIEQNTYIVCVAKMTTIL